MRNLRCKTFLTNPFDNFYFCVSDIFITFPLTMLPDPSHLFNVYSLTDSLFYDAEYYNDVKP